MKNIKGNLLTTTPPVSGGLIYGKDIKKNVKDDYKKNNLNECKNVR